MNIIHFDVDGTVEQWPQLDLEQLQNWLVSVARSEKKTIQELTYILCDDEYLLEMNNTYLSHDYYTDIITFPYSTDDVFLAGDMFISWDRIQENAEELGIQVVEELRRVMVHGLLHLIGYKDQTEEEENMMRSLEDKYLEMKIM